MRWMRCPCACALPFVFCVEMNEMNFLAYLIDMLYQAIIPRLSLLIDVKPSWAYLYQAIIIYTLFAYLIDMMWPLRPNFSIQK